MNYFVHVTDKADQDLGESFDYIDLTLKNPLAADVLVDTGTAFHFSQTLSRCP